MNANIKSKIKHVISYFRWLVKKQEITELDLCQYLRKTIRNILYVNQQHLINRKRVIRRKNKIILKHNNMQYKSWPRKGADKVRKQHIEDALNWSKRIVLYLKRQRALEKLKNKELHSKSILQSDEIRELNERIEEYKRNAQKNAAINVTHNTPEKEHQEMLQNSTNSQIENKSPNQGEECSGKRVNFLDYLINKLTNDGVHQGAGVPPKRANVVHQNTVQPNVLSKGANTEQQDTGVPSKRASARILNLIRKEQHDDGGETSNSSDFMGFEETETQNCLLATPEVPLQSDKSAFVSEELDTFLRENSLENSTDVDLPTFQTFEEGLVCEGAPPPIVKIQKVPTNFGKARTVAEKRMLFGTKNRAKYFIIENENTVYREFKKCTESGQCNKELIEQLQNMEVPLTRDTWTAASWLRTRNERYYYQTLNIDGKEYKLSGSRGNHDSKLFAIQNKTPIVKYSKTGCPTTCTQKSIIKGIRLRQTGLNLKDITNTSIVQNVSKLKKNNHSLLNSLKNDENYKPGPLSRKRLLDTEKKEISLAVYEMPTMQIEVYPKVNRPLDERIKPYLKLVLPSSRISREWAEFSVSTLVTKSSEPPSGLEKPFTFNIPYLNNQTTMLVRKVCKRNEKVDNAILESTKHVDWNNELEATCANVLTEMIDSVALGLSENSLIKNDPDIDYNQNKVRCTNEARNVLSKEAAVDPSASGNSQKAVENNPEYQKRRRLLLKELKQLNATIVQTDDIHSTGAIKCNKEYCQLGCVCPSVLSMSTSSHHCSRIECMLRCICDKNADLIHTNESALLIREKATARLAKVEKEFCSTLVLTNDSTYLVNESHGERRRSKRAPKRFDDYVNERDVYQTNNDETSQEPSEQDNRNESMITLKKHCNVVVDKLPVMENIEPWCMVHCLYKCFCNGDLIEGEPFKIKVDDTVEEAEMVYTKKRQYSFAKEESKKPNTTDMKKPCTADIRKASSTYINEPHFTDIKRKYYSSAYVYGSRIAKIPSKFYRIVNKGRAKTIKLQACFGNRKHKLDILNRHIAKSLAFPDCSSLNVPKSIQSPKKQHHVKEMLDPIVHPRRTESAEIPASNIHPQRTESEEIPQLNIQPPEQSPVETTTSVPVISSVVSLNPNSRNPKIQFHSIAMQFLNTAVTTSIKSIRNMLNENSKRIFDPVQRTLHSMQWSYFLDAYVDDIVFVWEICINNKNILIATTKNMMPQIAGAMSAVNIKISSSNDLPLLGKMLRSRVCCPKTKSLSVLLAGQNGYWLIIGFHNTQVDISQTGLNIFDVDTGQVKIKPTPQTHPEIREKINELYKIFVLRQMRLAKQMHDNNSSNKFVPISKALDSNIEYAEISDSSIAVENNPSGNDSLLALKSSSGDNAERGDSTEDTIAPDMNGKANAALSTLSPRTNIEVKQLPHALVGSIIIPVPTRRHHFWYMVVVGDDCSHVYVPKWKDFLSISRIQDSTVIATRNHKSVMLGNVSNGSGIYVTPNSDKTFYVGPFFNNPKLDLLVCKMFNGKILLREDFAKNHNLEYTTKTIAYCLQLKECNLILPKENQSGKFENRTSKTAEVSRKRPSTEPGSNRSLLKKMMKHEYKHFPFGYNSTQSSEDVLKNPYKTNMLQNSRETTTAAINISNFSFQNKQRFAMQNNTPNNTVTSTSPSQNSHLGREQVTASSKIADNLTKKSNSINSQRQSSLESPAAIAGFFITSALKLGKVPARKLGGIFEIQSPSSKRWLKFYTENQVHNFLMGKLTLQTRTTYASQNLQWRFVDKFYQNLERYPLGDYHFMNNIIPIIGASIKDKTMGTTTGTSHEKNMSVSAINSGQLKTSPPPFNRNVLIPKSLGLQRIQTIASDVIVIDD